jgi:hypothetical protein
MHGRSVGGNDDRTRRSPFRVVDDRHPRLAELRRGERQGGRSFADDLGEVRAVYVVGRGVRVDGRDVAARRLKGVGVDSGDGLADIGDGAGLAYLDLGTRSRR